MSSTDNETARRAIAIAAALAVASPGEKAETRRMSEAGSAFFWRQVVRLGITPTQEERWLFFTRLIALMTPASREISVHRTGHALGAVLAEAGLSEHRFARLIAARADLRDDGLERAIRMAARKIDGLDVVDLAWFLLRPAATGRIARDYYQYIDSIKNEEPKHG